MPNYNHLQFLVLIADYILLVLLLAFVALKRGREIFSVLNPVDRFVIPVAVVVAFLLRWFLPEHTVAHVNGHGYRHIGMAIFPESDIHVYGSGYQALYHLLYKIFPPVTGVVIDANIVFGALTVLFLGLLVANIFPRGGGAAALALALTPVHVKLSATEDPSIPAMFFFILALWSACELRRRPNWDLALLCPLAAAPAAQMRAEFIFMPLIVLMFLLLCRRKVLTFLCGPLPFIVTAAMAILLYGHFAWMKSIHLPPAGNSHYLSLLDLNPKHVLWGLSGKSLLWEHSCTPPLFLFCALVGVIAAFARRAAGAMLFALIFLGFTYLYGAATAHYADLLRFSVPAQIFLAGLCGMGIGVISKFAAVRMRNKTAGLLVLALIPATGIISYYPIKTLGAQEREYLLIQRAYQALPARCTLVTPKRTMADGKVVASFPIYEYDFKLRRSGRNSDTTQPPRAGPPNNDDECTTIWNSNWLEAGKFDPGGDQADQECTIYFRGLACSSFTSEEASLKDSPLRPECKAFEERYRLEPVYVEKLETADLPTYYFRLPDPNFTMGFYKVFPAK